MLCRSSVVIVADPVSGQDLLVEIDVDEPRQQVFDLLEIGDERRAGRPPCCQQEVAEVREVVNADRDAGLTAEDRCHGTRSEGHVVRGEYAGAAAERQRRVQAVVPSRERRAPPDNAATHGT